jgi:hypothetical protein
MEESVARHWGREKVYRLGVARPFLMLEALFLTLP